MGSRVGVDIIAGFGRLRVLVITWFLHWSDFLLDDGEVLGFEELCDEVADFVLVAGDGLDFDQIPVE